MNLKVLIPTGGRWVDLWEITKYLNKSLIKIWKKPAISYIIEAYPENTEFVITTWYYSNQVEDFIKTVYPNKNIQLVGIDKFEWPWSSIIYSMLKAREYLKTPFILHACDTVILDKIEFIDANWAWGYKWKWSSNYAWFNVIGKDIEKIYEKWIIEPDFIHIWIVWIKDYEKFWSITQELYDINPNNPNNNDILVINKMIESWLVFKLNEFKFWYDTWNVEGLNRAKKEMPDSFHILDKLEESIYIFDDFVVKFFCDKNLSDKRVKRTEYLNWLVPVIEWHNNNFFRYKYVSWMLYSRVANASNFFEFLNWSKEMLWKPSNEVNNEEFRKVCYDFYYTKSIKRINKFMTDHLFKDEENIINWESVPTIKKIIEMTDFDLLCDTSQVHFHWDFILDNIIQTNTWFCLLDWRQDFWWLLESWDLYYDLSKLNHNLTVNHDIINHDLFSVEKDWNIINIDINRKQSLVECQKIFDSFVVANWFNMKKIKILTAIIWLNMSPLHHHPFDKFLFYFWKLNLWRAINE